MATCGSAQSLYLGFPAVWRPVVQKGVFSRQPQINETNTQEIRSGTQVLSPQFRSLLEPWVPKTANRFSTELLPA